MEEIIWTSGGQQGGRDPQRDRREIPTDRRKIRIVIRALEFAKKPQVGAMGRFFRVAEREEKAWLSPGLSCRGQGGREEKRLATPDQTSGELR